MRTPVQTFISIALATVLTTGLLPAQAFAAATEGVNDTLAEIDETASDVESENAIADENGASAATSSTQEDADSADANTGNANEPNTAPEATSPEAAAADPLAASLQSDAAPPGRRPIRLRPQRPGQPKRRHLHRAVERRRRQNHHVPRNRHRRLGRLQGPHGRARLLGQRQPGKRVRPLARQLDHLRNVRRRRRRNRLPI